MNRNAYRLAVGTLFAGGIWLGLALTTDDQAHADTPPPAVTTQRPGGLLEHAVKLPDKASARARAAVAKVTAEPQPDPTTEPEPEPSDEPADEPAEDTPQQQEPDGDEPDESAEPPTEDTPAEPPTPSPAPTPPTGPIDSLPNPGDTTDGAGDVVDELPTPPPPPPSTPTPTPTPTPVPSTDPAPPVDDAPDPHPSDGGTSPRPPQLPAPAPVVAPAPLPVIGPVPAAEPAAGNVIEQLVADLTGSPDQPICADDPDDARRIDRDALRALLAGYHQQSNTPAETPRAQPKPGCPGTPDRDATPGTVQVKPPTQSAADQAVAIFTGSHVPPVLGRMEHTRARSHLPAGRSTHIEPSPA